MSAVDMSQCPDNCEECGKPGDLRPYGKGGKWICMPCGMKNEKETKEQFGKILNGEKAPGVKVTESVTPEIISGTFYRVDSGFTHDRKATAMDVINWEAEEVGNDDCIQGKKNMTDAGIDLTKYPAKDIVWVTKSKKDAKRYVEEYGGKIQNVVIKKGIVVVDDDGGGSLILKLE